MSLLAILSQYLPVGLAVLLPLSVVFYGWRGLSIASRTASLVKMALAAAFGVAVEATRRYFGISWVDVGDLALDGVTWVVENFGGLLP